MPYVSVRQVSIMNPDGSMQPLHNGQNRFQQEKRGLSQRPTHWFRTLIPTKRRRWIWDSGCDAEDIQTLCRSCIQR